MCVCVCVVNKKSSACSSFSMAALHSWGECPRKDETYQCCFREALEQDPFPVAEVKCILFLNCFKVDYLGSLWIQYM